MTIEALEQVDKYIKEIDHLRKYISRLETQIVEQEPCEDCINREDAIGIVAHKKEIHIDNRERYPINYGTICDIDLELQQLPPVTSTRKKGKWIVEDSGNYNGKWSTCYCSNCKDYYTRNWREMNYCPNCGAKMGVVEE